ncbi:putative feruloyl esterase [Helianthus annuus]|nr:putative feruloyl esterase [Helianthus annuus]KAJ0620982.1 putative feruloyl esterase [Helianthus annuus]KAJ0625549.1 putative feruloyl esterase [Helianthus annuus]KAJ0781949.1 putative feruloyl esterase [Helianthus annuus]
MRSGILDGVSRAKEAYGDLKIMVTGHSMGGAMAAFCGLDLALIYRSKNIQFTTFGMPRIGNAAFASYYSQAVPNTFRVTHGHDLVPHLPSYYHHFPQKKYHHFPTEALLECLRAGGGRVSAHLGEPRGWWQSSSRPWPQRLVSQWLARRSLPFKKEAKLLIAIALLKG